MRIHGARYMVQIQNQRDTRETPSPRLSYLPLPSGPSEMLPVAEAEFMIQETNGQMEITALQSRSIQTEPGMSMVKHTFCFYGSTHRTERPFAVELTRLVFFSLRVTEICAHTKSDPIV